jgi:hypothetical protein
MPCGTPGYYVGQQVALLHFVPPQLAAGLIGTIREMRRATHDWRYRIEFDDGQTAWVVEAMLDPTAVQQTLPFLLIAEDMGGPER